MKQTALNFCLVAVAASVAKGQSPLQALRESQQRILERDRQIQQNQKPFFQNTLPKTLPNLPYNNQHPIGSEASPSGGTGASGADSGISRVGEGSEASPSGGTSASTKEEPQEKKAADRDLTKEQKRLLLQRKEELTKAKNIEAGNNIDAALKGSQSFLSSESDATASQSQNRGKRAPLDPNGGAPLTPAESAELQAKQKVSQQSRVRSSDLERNQQAIDANGGAPLTQAENAEIVDGEKGQIAIVRRNEAVRDADLDAAAVIDKRYMDLRKLGLPDATKDLNPNQLSSQEKKGIVDKIEAKTDVELSKNGRGRRPNPVQEVPAFAPGSLLNVDRP